jgi:hypothetical protein
MEEILVLGNTTPFRFTPLSLLSLPLLSLSLLLFFSSDSWLLSADHDGSHHALFHYSPSSRGQELQEVKTTYPSLLLTCSLLILLSCPCLPEVARLTKELLGGRKILPLFPYLSW